MAVAGRDRSTGKPPPPVPPVKYYTINLTRLLPTSSNHMKMLCFFFGWSFVRKRMRRKVGGTMTPPNQLKQLSICGTNEQSALLIWQCYRYGGKKKIDDFITSPHAARTVSKPGQNKQKPKDQTDYGDTAAARLRTRPQLPVPVTMGLINASR